MNKSLRFLVLVLLLALVGSVALANLKGNVFDFGKTSNVQEDRSAHDQALVTKFDYLSKNGNSACSASFRESIPSMSDDARLQGSCCSPMNLHRYSEQTRGLKKFKSALRQAQGGEQSRTIAGQIDKIPNDPYDIEAKLAKELLSYYDMELSADEQKAYDYAMQNSHEKGPCCCKCWRWYVYGGLGKYLIRNHQFSGQQVTDVWNLSDGCGGEGDHVHHG